MLTQSNDFETWLISREMTQEVVIPRKFSKRLSSLFHFYFNYDVKRALEKEGFIDQLPLPIADTIEFTLAAQFSSKYGFFEDLSPELATRIITMLQPI